MATAGIPLPSVRNAGTDGRPLPTLDATAQVGFDRRAEGIVQKLVGCLCRRALQWKDREPDVFARAVLVDLAKLTEGRARFVDGGGWIQVPREPNGSRRRE